MRWVQRYVPEFEKRWNRARKAGLSWRVDETYVKTWMSKVLRGSPPKASNASLAFGWPIQFMTGPNAEWLANRWLISAGKAGLLANHAALVLLDPAPHHCLSQVHVHGAAYIAHA